MLRIILIAMTFITVCLIPGLALCESGPVEQTFPAGDVSSISFDITTDKLTIGPSGDDMIHVSYNASSDGEYTLELKDGVLMLKQEVGLASLFDFGFLTSKHECSLLIPESFAGGAEVKGTTVELWAADISSLSKFHIGVITLNAHAENCAFGEFNIECTTGDINVSNVSCQSFATRCTTARVVLDKLDSSAINIEASTAEIRGVLAGSEADYTINSHVTYGSNSLPESQAGGERQLNVNAGSASVSFDFAN